MSSKPIVWFKNFVGVGYRYHDVFMNVFPLFEDKMFAHRLWKNTIHYWPDDKIKLRFVERGSDYWFILYDGSDYNDDNTGFVKMVPVSENYERFKVGYENKAILRFGIYKPEKDGKDQFKLEVLKKTKSVYDIAFLQYSKLSPESMEWKCIQDYEKKI